MLMKTKPMKTKDNLFYITFHTLFRTSFLFLYKTFTVLGRENLPKGESYFITPTHQNAMMDAMAILFTTKAPHPFFLARADIFKAKPIGFMLGLLKMLPIYRMRDGKDSLQNNDAIFKKTVDVISQGVPLTIFPEGNHEGHRRFRAVKKGVIRTAFMALEQFPEGKKLFIVPTGIEYNVFYEKAMQNIVVFYGKPICVNDFWDLYQEDQARAERQLQLEIFSRMTDQMIDIKTEDYYDYYDIVRESACGDVMQQKGVKRTPEQKLYAQQVLIKGLDKTLEKDETPFAALQEKAKLYQEKMANLKLRNWLFDYPSYSKGRLFLEILAAIVLLPVAVYGRMTNGLQYAFANVQAEKNKDPQWRSSVRYIMGFTLMPISHLLLACVTFFLFESAWWYLLAVLSFAFSGNFSLRYEVWLKKIMGRIRYNKLQGNPSAEYKEMQALREEINSFALGTL